MRQRLEKVFLCAAQKLRRLVREHPDQFPMYTTGGKWNFGGETWTNWCEGFLGGQLWLLYRHTEEPEWRRLAEHYARLIEPRKTDRKVHDLGFLFWPTWKPWYDLSGDPDHQAVLIEAGQTMGLRYREKGKYFHSFLAENSLFIDIMMNVGIVFYAARQTEDLALEEKALRHCLTTRRYLVRGDGSTAHEGIFDQETGEFLRQSTQQGWRSDSSWARGLSWALYGFGTVYEMTGDPRFLDTAEACAHFYMERTPAHGVPPNDWDEPEPLYPYESSAAAIAASGLLQLAGLGPLRRPASVYREYALRILETLSEPEFLAFEELEWEGTLKHGIYHLRKGLGVDESVMWGDYFLLEACFRVLHGE